MVFPHIVSPGYGEKWKRDLQCDTRAWTERDKMGPKIAFVLFLYFCFASGEESVVSDKRREFMLRAAKFKEELLASKQCSFWRAVFKVNLKLNFVWESTRKTVLCIFFCDKDLKKSKSVLRYTGTSVRN